jgi:hypothetical protein
MERFRIGSALALGFDALRGHWFSIIMAIMVQMLGMALLSMIKLGAASTMLNISASFFSVGLACATAIIGPARRLSADCSRRQIMLHVGLLSMLTCLSGTLVFAAVGVAAPFGSSGIILFFVGLLASCWLFGQLILVPMLLMGSGRPVRAAVAESFRFMRPHQLAGLSLGFTALMLGFLSCAMLILVSQLVSGPFQHLRAQFMTFDPLLYEFIDNLLAGLFLSPVPLAMAAACLGAWRHWQDQIRPELKPDVADVFG